MLTAMITCLVMQTPAAAQAPQDLMPQHERNWKKLQSYRIWTIINALDLDATSEKGLELLNAINRFTVEEREFLLAKNHQAILLRHAINSSDPDEEAIVAAITELERIATEHRQMKQREADEMARLLTPLERARLLLAEETFRQHLRNAMRGNRRGSPGKNKPPFDRH